LELQANSFILQKIRKMKRIAAITMVRNGDFFLSRWVQYYGSRIGKENLYILFDGTDQIIPLFTDGCNTELIPRTEGPVRDADKGRIAIISARTAKLFDRYDMVIGTDVDEFLIVDPALGVSLQEFLSGLDTKGRISFSGLGCDVIHNLNCEKPLDHSKGMLEQRSFVYLSSRYTKTTVLCKPVPWGSGFHRTKRGNYCIVKDLYLFHFGCANLSDNDRKNLDEDLQARGWGRHLNKRIKLIHTVSGLPVREWDKWIPKARLIQTVCRPPYMLNKPAMLGLKILVKRPERFSGIV